MLKDKGLIIGIIATFILIGGGIFLMTKPAAPVTPQIISNNILIPKDSYITSGIANGNYLPATDSAKVTIVEFGDYQCPACATYQPNVKQLLTDFAGKINYVFRDFAFIGPESTKASEAVYCAADQNKFWEFHEYLYSHQAGENKDGFSDTNLKSFATALSLDIKSFSACLDSDKYKSKVESGSGDASLAAVNSTPAFFVNGVKIDNLTGNYSDFKKLISEALNKE